jgi:hypothetical protein
MTKPNGAKNRLAAAGSKVVPREILEQKRDALGQGLRRIYQDVTDEPIPDSIADILKKLE